MQKGGNLPVRKLGRQVEMTHAEGVCQLIRMMDNGPSPGGPVNEREGFIQNGRGKIVRCLAAA